MLCNVVEHRGHASAAPAAQLDGCNVIALLETLDSLDNIVTGDNSHAVRLVFFCNGV